LICRHAPPCAGLERKGYVARVVFRPGAGSKRRAAPPPVEPPAAKRKGAAAAAARRDPWGDLEKDLGLEVRGSRSILESERPVRM